MQPYERYFADIQRVLQRMGTTGVFAKMRVVAQQLNSIVLPPTDAIAAIVKAADIYTRLFQQIRLPDFERWARAEREATEILVTRGWWPHPNWPVSAVHEVIRLKREGRIRQLDRLICESYELNRARPMRQAIDRWIDVPEFHARRRLFEDGLWAYRKGKCGLALTHWLPQVEGVLRGFAERQGFAQSGWKRAGRDIIQRQPDYASSFREACLGALLSVYDDSLPVGRHPAGLGAFPVQRDAILHGVDLRFGRRAHAMRVFLLLDTLHYFIDQLERQEKSAA
jgi:hypothetical protein